MTEVRGHAEFCPSPNEDCTCGFSELFWAEVEAKARAVTEPLFHTTEKPLADRREGLLPKRRAHMGLTGHEAGRSEVDTCDRGKPKHGDQTRGTTDDHIGVRAKEARPAGLSAPADQTPNKRPKERNHSWLS